MVVFLYWSILDPFLFLMKRCTCLLHVREKKVSWAFLLEVLKHFGFGQKWCNLLCLLLSTSSTKVLVNGEPGASIAHHRGLRQGDPLSPMLFLLVMEVLNAMVVKAVQEDYLQPLVVPYLKHQISLYADDVIMFLRPARNDILLISQMLKIFGHASVQVSTPICLKVQFVLSIVLLMICCCFLSYWNVKSRIFLVNILGYLSLSGSQLDLTCYLWLIR